MANEFWLEIEKKSNKDEASVNDELKKAYEEAYKELEARIATFIQDHPNMSYVQAQQLSQMKSLLLQIQDALTKLYGKVSDLTYQQDLKEAEYGYFGEWYNIEKQVGVQLSFGQLPDQKIKKLIETSADGIPLSQKLYGALLGDTQDAIKETLKQGLILGYDNRKMARRLSDEVNVSYRKAKTIIRTESGRINSLARQEAQEEAVKQGVDLQKRWISTLDRKTRHSHAVLDGQIVGKDEEFTTLDGSKTMQPRMFGIAGEDINCRCGCTSVVNGYSGNRRRDNETKQLLVVKDYDTWLKKNHPEDYAKFMETKKKVIADAKANGIVQPTKTKKAKAGPTPEQIKAKADYDDHKTVADSLQDNMSKLSQNQYIGIWKHAVTAADYEKLYNDGSFHKKVAYYSDIMKDKTAPQIKKDAAAAHYSELEEFYKKGSEYTLLKHKLDDIKKQMGDFLSKISPEPDAATIPVKKGDDPYSQIRKDNAFWLKDKRTADNLLRDKSGEAWRSANSIQRKAGYEYTAGSGKFNRPLRGFDGSWSNFKGVGKVDLDSEGASKLIDGLENMISKSSYDFDIWVNRGVESNYGMESFLGLNHGDIKNMTEQQLKTLLIDKKVRDNAFMSTSPVKGAGFSGHKINAYCPKGTKMIYAEPFSQYGHGDKKNWDGLSRQSSFGSEFEVILQKGYEYRITKLEKKYDTLYIDVEVILPEK